MKKPVIITVAQIEEYLSGNPSPETLEAVKLHFESELMRRNKVGRKATSPLTRAEQIREASRRYRKSMNADQRAMQVKRQQAYMKRKKEKT